MGNRDNRELKQQRQRRLQKRHLKSEFEPLQTLSRLFYLVYFVKCFWSWILKDCIKIQEKKRKLLSCVPVLHKTWIQAFSRCSRATTAKKCTKKAWCTCKVVVLLIKPVAFLPFSFRPRRRCLSSLMALSAHRGMWHITPPQADISVILTLVTNCNHAWSQGNYNFYLGQISFVFCGIYQSIS